jgi:hypothetical protein
MFEVGKQVVCIADFSGKWLNSYGEGYKGPHKGQVMTVRDIITHPAPWDLGLMFYEISTFVDGSKYEATYGAKHFRPVKDTSIEKFTSMLNKVDA